MRANLIGVVMVGSGKAHEWDTYNPYLPSWIPTPEARMECADSQYICEVGKQQCRHWPYRMCVFQCDSANRVNESCYDGCREEAGEVGPAGGVCVHKRLFPILHQDLMLFFVLFLVAIASGAAGIGGGGLIVPITMIISSFGIKEAVPLSHSAVLGNAIAQLIMNCPQNHPSCQVRPLVHYELTFLLLPAMLGGTSLGVVIGRVLPPTLLVILSIVLLFLAFTKTVKKGVHVYHDCMKMCEERKANNMPVVMRPVQDPNGPPVFGSSGIDAIAQSLSGTFLAESEKMRVPWKVILLMVAFNLFVLCDQLLQSDDLFHGKAFERCHTIFWLSLVGLYPFVFAALYFGIKSLGDLAQFHADRNEIVEGDPVVTTKSAIFFAVITGFIGLLGGILGLGGGEFMVPLLLEFGLMPRVAAATSGFLIAFSTSNNIIHYLLAGTLNPVLGYAVAIALIANCGAFVGLVVRDTAYMRTNSYIVVFVLAGLLFTSMWLLFFHGFIMSEISFEMEPFCA